jgi:hypothetical protein
VPGGATDESADQRHAGSLRAIEEGVIAVVAKPNVVVRDFLRDSRLVLVDAVRGAAQARVRRRPSSLAR